MQRRTLDIGALNKRLEFLKPDPDSTDALGQHTGGIKTVCTVWGSFYPVRGQEYYEVHKIESKITHKCYVRHRESLAGIDTNWFIRHDSTEYAIESVIDVGGEGKFFEIYCSERINKEEHV